jgi:DNA-binding response OmpR family regulator
MNIGFGARRKTILLVDTDPHARATLRLALEAAGFSVGEAANDKEGERTAKRIRPDAILCELISGNASAAPTLPERLLTDGLNIPCYIVSGVADALLGSVGFHELGIEGVFLKPADTAIVIQALQSRLGTKAEDVLHA